MDGIIIIDKQKEYTSHDIVAKVKRILGVKKVGHTRYIRSKCNRGSSYSYRKGN